MLERQPQQAAGRLPHVRAEFTQPAAQLSTRQSPQCGRVGVTHLARNYLEVAANRNEVLCPFDSQVLEKCQWRLAEHCLGATLQGTRADGQCARRVLNRKPGRAIVASPSLESCDQRIGVSPVSNTPSSARIASPMSQMTLLMSFATIAPSRFGA
jgi:hypothetical protein